MTSSIGWLLDVYFETNSAVLWFRTEQGKSVRLRDNYFPDFFIEPNSGIDAEALTSCLLEHPQILRVDDEKKFTALDARERSDVLHVFVDSIKSFNPVLRSLQALHPQQVKAFYNTDLMHVQRYLFSKSLVPMAKVEFYWNENSSRFLRSKRINEDGRFKPPFSMLTFDLAISGETLTPNPAKDPIVKIVIQGNYSEPLSERNNDKTIGGSELDVLKEFEIQVNEQDPDFLTSTEGEVASLRYVLERAKVLQYNIQLGRESCDLSRLKNLYPFAVRGRVCVEIPVESSLTMPIGISGIVELATYTVMPPGISSSKGGGGWSTDCRQSYEAFNRGVLLPSRQDRGFFKFTATARDILERDRGSLILSPKVGIHENVAACDFESMFPHIILRHNLSYETVKPRFVEKRRRGFLSDIAEQILDRRLRLKRLRNSFPKNSAEWWYSEQRQLALKMILVCFYGYSGCFANKFNNVTLYEEINKIARESMLTTLRLGREQGFAIIYGDCDSIFVRKSDATLKHYEEFCSLVTQHTNLPMAVDRHYKFLILLPQESDPEIEATRHYFGKLTSGEVYFRGIELRRHDYPTFLKNFQHKLIEILFDADSSKEVKTRQYKEALNFVLETYEIIMSGDVEPETLVISKVLRKPVTEYHSMFPHVSAAMNMIQQGKTLKVGQFVQFLYVNADHANPLRRVMPVQLMNGDHHYYDREKYAEMMFDISETVLGWNGFHRGRFGIKSKPRNYLEELRMERQQELMLDLQHLSEICDDSVHGVAE